MDAIENPQSTPPLSSDEIDEVLYSKQLYVLGSDAMRKMAGCRALISGINGVGLEVAKSVILGGFKSVTLHDEQQLARKDLSSLYYAKQSDIGQNRAQVVHSKLKELNCYVEVNVLEGELSRKILKSFDIIVLCAESLHEVERKVADCEALELKYILALSHGVFGCLFNNFGRAFYVHDQDGKEPIRSYIETLSADVDTKMITVTTVGDKPHLLRDKSIVTFEEIVGLPELNDKDKSFEITYISPHSFSFHYDNISSTECYTGYGIAIEIKSGATIDFKSIDHCLNDEDIMLYDSGKISHPKQIISLYALTADPHFLPGGNQRRNQDIAKLCQDYMRSKYHIEVEIDELLAKSFVSQYNKGQLAPLAAIIGSLAASEAMKALTRKFTPIKQWFAFDAIECIRPEMFQDTEICIEPTGSLEKQILGRTTGEYLESAKIFMVGTGAIGCELLKLFALMNVATGASGVLKVTDMNRVEKSDLNRHLLFRPHGVGSFKSKVACRAAKQINPLLNILPLTDRVNSQADSKYNVQFYRDLDLIVNALDNTETSLFMDSRCVEHGLPLLQCRTIGTKGETQVVVPNLTESLGSSFKSRAEPRALCAIKNFPYLIEHTIHWSREFFESKFVLPSQTLSKFFSTTQNGHEYLNNLFEKDEVDHLCLMIAKHPLRNYLDCVFRSLHILIEEFVYNIVQITTILPEDHLTNSGRKFWTGHKRYPRPLAIDLAHDQDQYDFVEAVAFQFTRIYGLAAPPANHKELIMVAWRKYSPKKFVVNKNAIIAENDEQLEEEHTLDMTPSKATSRTISDIVDYHSQCVNASSSENRTNTNLHENCEILNFEKDDDSNLQIQLITAAANLRGKNYRIRPVTRSETRRIAGEIIPAINTTSSLVAGLIALELYKLSMIPGHNSTEEFKSKCPVPVELFRNSHLDLSVPFITQWEPMPATLMVYRDQELGEHSFDLWHFLEIDDGGNKNLSLAQFLEQFAAKYNLNIEMLYCGESLLYSDFHPPLASETYKNNGLVMLIERELKIELESSSGDSFVILKGIMEIVGDHTYDTPKIKFYYCK